MFVSLLIILSCLIGVYQKRNDLFTSVQLKIITHFRPNTIIMLISLIAFKKVLNRTGDLNQVSRHRKQSYACYPKERLFWNGSPIFQSALENIIADVLIKIPLAWNCAKTAYRKQRDDEHELRVRCKCLRKKAQLTSLSHQLAIQRTQQHGLVYFNGHCVLCIYRNFYNSPWCTFFNTRKVEHGNRVRKTAVVISFFSITCFQSVVGRP